MRSRLLALKDDEHIFFLTIHHIVFDGWSIGVLCREWSALYEASIRGEASPLPEPALQYADYSEWQRGWLKSEVLDRQLGYWRERLAHLPRLELPLDQPRPPTQSFRGARERLELSDALRAKLVALSRREGVTLYMVLLGAFQVLLARYTGQEDVVVGTPIAIRTRSELEGLIGFFVNSLVMRTDVSGNPTFKELLRRVREAALGAYAHQDLPFEKLVESLSPERDPSRNPLFQVTLALQNAPMEPFELSALKLSPVDLEPTTARFDVELYAWEGKDLLRLDCYYNTDLFEPNTVKRLLRHYAGLLEKLSQDPAQRVQDVDLLSEDERRRVLAKWNETAEVYPGAVLVPDAISAQAARTPEAVAVVSGQETLTYAELEGRSNQLARWLRRSGVGPEVLVGLCAERSVELVIGIAGILKAGGAFVPLDPELPDERLKWQIEEGGLRLVLTQAQHQGRIDPRVTRRLCLDTEWGKAGSETRERIESGVRAGNPAYAIYTSGSTGRPKGVLVTHGAMVNHMEWMRRSFGLRREDRFIQKTPYSFDASVWELVLPLMMGSELVMAPPGSRRDPAEMLRMMECEGVTVLQVVPSLLRLLLETGGLERCRQLRHVFCGGEALDRRLAEEAGERLGVPLHNLYGPTEACIDSSSYSVVGGEEGISMPIGRPIANTQMYVLDLRQEPVPEGVAGELCIGGAGLARGYLNRPDLTAERFIADPHTGEPGRRLYRTGDRARHRQDGMLEHLGRGDHQVKLRGYRIELGEIETALKEHDAVKEAVVVVKERTLPDQRLVAYVEIDTEGERFAGLGQELPAEHLSRWQQLFEETYGGGLGGRDRAVYAASKGPRLEDPAIKAGHIGLEVENPANNPDSKVPSGQDPTIDASDIGREGEDTAINARGNGRLGEDPTFDTVGWNSSYTGQPFPAAEMREWLDGTADRILSLQPESVLEIGCGTDYELLSWHELVASGVVPAATWRAQNHIEWATRSISHGFGKLLLVIHLGIDHVPVVNA